METCQLEALRLAYLELREVPGNEKRLDEISDTLIMYGYTWDCETDSFSYD